MKSFFIFILVVVGCGYFFYARDRYISYPIHTSLTNLEGNSIAVNVLWRDGDRLQFEKSDESKLYFYQMSDLNILSRIKVAFFPVSEDKPESYSQHVQVDVRSAHKDGIREEIAKHQNAIILLSKKIEVSDSIVETLTCEQKIRETERKINKLEYKLTNL
ncbi:hypothetical protein ACWPKS_18710 [Coraliomargarita sp. W4R72]